jgi:polyhydroxybutyrate depolymerase
MRKLGLLGLLLMSGIVCVGQVITEGFIFLGYSRVYDLHLPPSWTPGSKLPVVMDLHYLGADGRDEDTLTQFNPIGDAEGFIVVHPYGQSTNWNVGQNAPFSSGEQDVAFISTLIDTLDARYGVDLNRIYATGFGQGGFMVHRLACALNNRIAAFAVVAGSMADSTAFYCQTSPSVPMMMIHGTADSVVPYFAGSPGIWLTIPDLVDFWKTRDTCLGNPVITNLPDLVQEGSTIEVQQWTCAPHSEVLLYKVIDGGFDWPGGSRNIGIGTTRNMDINASEHIWEFFKRFSLDGTPLAVEENAMEVSDVQIFPQPASDVLHVIVEKGNLNGLSLMNLQGMRVDVPIHFVSSRNADLDLSALPSGIYIMQVDGSVRRVAVVR